MARSELVIEASELVKVDGWLVNDAC